jgi:hypothetical protein
LEVKGADYAERVEDGDRLSNFKAVAEVIRATTGRDELPVTAGLVWFVYFYKHLVPIVKALLLEEELQSESLGGRFTDAINYLLLGEGLAVDQQEFVQRMVEDMERQVEDLQAEVDAKLDPEPATGDGPMVIETKGEPPTKANWLERAAAVMKEKAGAAPDNGDAPA